uniref:ubiquitinyl hydrolase 1 n=1 Tax=Ditylenchus dipsaci TaxID=166011 RepID=A0A915DH54_9BILA
MTDTIYFEKQETIFTIDFLQEIARELDRREQEVLSTGARFRSENADRSGFFSIQVIQLALETLSTVRLLPYDNPDAKRYRENPSIARAYLLNSNKHWFAARKFASKHWFLLNSLRNGPEYMASGYFDVYLPQLQADGVSIFVVVGPLPECFADSVMDSTFDPSWNVMPTVQNNKEFGVRDDIAEAIHHSLQEEARRRADRMAEEDAVAIASAMSKETWKEEDAMAMSVELSLNSRQNGNNLSACVTK